MNVFRHTPWLVTGLAVLVSGCATKRPVLYDNAMLQSVGREAAEKDIEACFAKASAAGLEARKGERVAENTGKSAVVGAAAGGAAGAFSRAESAGTGAAAGAAGAAAGTLVHSLFRSGEPDPTQKRYVEECLREKGYQVIGWK